MNILSKYLRGRGVVLIILIVFFNLVLWLGSKFYYQDFFTSNYKYMAKIMSLTGTLLMAMSLVLTVRAKFLEDLFGGLDKVFSAHHKLGRWAFTLIIFHPIFLSLINASSMIDVLLYYVPNFSNDYEMGKVIGSLSMLAFFGLLYLTISAKISYELWQSTHSWFGLLFCFIILHIVLVNGDIYKYPIFAVWYNIWLVIGVFAYFWSCFLRFYIGKRYVYKIDSLESIAPFYEVVFSPVSSEKNKIIEHMPGQFLYTKFLDPALPQEWHPYSIASYYQNGKIKMGIKELGDFTKKIGTLETTTQVIFKGPYGKLSEKLFTYPNKEVVLIGGGVGITPIISIWEYILEDKRHNSTIVYVSNTVESATFNNDFLALNEKYGIGDNNYWLYLDQNKNFFNIDILADRIQNFDNKIFIICGPRRMMVSMVNGLKSKGVKNSNIVIENFSYGIGEGSWFAHFDFIKEKFVALSK
jgi:predicted ferric reductase